VEQDMSTENKPGRPFGVTFAIIASIFLFSLVPIANVVFIWLVNQQVNYTPTEGGMGINVLGVQNSSLLLQTVLGIVVIIAAIFAWRGRPTHVRFVFVGLILFLGLITFIVNISPALTAEACTQLPCDSSETLNRSFARIQLTLTILIPLYVVWYMNRGPARAFYRGYYLTDPAESVGSKEELGA
jgi:hypothetical protein